MEDKNLAVGTNCEVKHSGYLLPFIALQLTVTDVMQRGFSLVLIIQTELWYSVCIPHTTATSHFQVLNAMWNGKKVVLSLVKRENLRFPFLRLEYLNMCSAVFGLSGSVRVTNLVFHSLIFSFHRWQDFQFMTLSLTVCTLSGWYQWIVRIFWGRQRTTASGRHLVTKSPLQQCLDPSALP